MNRYALALLGSLGCVGSSREDQHPPPSAESVSVAAAAEDSTAGHTVPGLVGTTWRLTELVGKPAPLGQDGKAATLELSGEDRRATGFAGCNRMSGGYDLEGDSLRLGPFALTRMACQKGMDLEKAYVETLRRARAYRQAGERLDLTDSNEIIARFEAQ
jgi:heat shock protein HslJ